MIEKIKYKCVECGGFDFVPKNSHSYITMKIRKKRCLTCCKKDTQDKSKKIISKKLYAVTCLNCEQKKTMRTKRIYCSDECMREHMKKNRPVRKAPKKKTEKELFYEQLAKANKIVDEEKKVMNTRVYGMGRYETINYKGDIK